MEKEKGKTKTRVKFERTASATRFPNTRAETVRPRIVEKISYSNAHII